MSEVTAMFNSFRLRFATSLTIYRGCLGLSAQSPRKVSKGVPRASRPGGGPKSQKRVENGAENLRKTREKTVNFRSSSGFLGPQSRESAATPFETFLENPNLLK